MTNDLDRHLRAIRTLSRTPAFSSTGPHASVHNPAWFSVDEEPIGSRKHLHQKLMTTMQERFGNVASERRAVILAGPPGAGKSTTLRAVLGNDIQRFAAVDADEFKVELLRQAVQDGSLEGFLKSDVIRDLESEGEQFFPMEYAALVHEESSLLAKLMRRKLVANGSNIVVDTVLANPTRAIELGNLFQSAGYQMRVLDVETTREISTARIEARWRSARIEALEGNTELGGRWVPSDFTRAVFNPDGTSRPEQSARMLAETFPTVTNYQLYRVHELTAGPQLEVEITRTAPGEPLMERLKEQARQTNPNSTANRAQAITKHLTNLEPFKRQQVAPQPVPSPISPDTPTRER